MTACIHYPDGQDITPEQQVQAGQEVTRDHLPRGPRSLQRGAALLCLLDRPQLWAHAAEFEGYQAGLRREMEGQQPPARPWLPQLQGYNEAAIRIFCNYPNFIDAASVAPFVPVDDPDEADVLFSPQPINAFMNIPEHQYVNQFPYEGCMIAKDLLPQTLRRLHSHQQAAQGPAEASDGASCQHWHPAWFPATYDLATEVQYFIKDYAEVRTEYPEMRE
eukprot:jgi/Astpho2/3636/Aster-x0173